MKKYICLFIAIAMIGGAIFTAGCGDSSILTGLGIVFAVAILASTGGSGAPIAFAASTRESHKAKIYLSSQISKGKVKVKITPMTKAGVAAAATELGGSVMKVNEQNQIEGKLSVTVPDQTYNQFKVEIVYNDSQNANGNVLLQSYFNHDPAAGDAPQQPVTPETTAKSIVYDEWKDTASDKSFDTFEQNLSTTGGETAINEIAGQIQQNLNAAVERGQLGNYSPVTDTAINQTCVQIAHELPAAPVLIETGTSTGGTSTFTNTFTTTHTSIMTGTGVVIDNSFGYQSGNSFSTSSGVLTDSFNGLQWYGQTFDSGKTWADANTWAQAVSQQGTGWTLPTISQLQTLYPHGWDTNYFPKFLAWSSTPGQQVDCVNTYKVYDFKSNRTSEFTVGTTVDYVLAVRPEPSKLRVVLTWGATPRDLDSHLTGPISGDSRFHVYYGSRLHYANDKKVAMLDFDITSGYGTETVTIYDGSPAGTYRYSVYDWTNGGNSNSSGLSNSGAKVLVYINGTLTATYEVPTEKFGYNWTVFEYDGTTLTPINTIESGKPQSTGASNSDIGLIQALPPKK
ncbi:MAG: hypothetical protein HQM10_10205 [Candidatus Riflebacteria bacterium]|nr:hypothetical protein [Candidatus Riflebacteria bacterium]